MQQYPMLTFIGAGNMAGSLIGGLIADGYESTKICVTDIEEAKLTQLKIKYGVEISLDNRTAIKQAEIIILAVKPQVLKDIAVSLADIVQARKIVVISIAAGITEKSLRQWLGEVAIVRCMPNTPAFVKSGATALYANQYVNQEQKAFAESLMRAVGLTLWLDNENHMHIVTALSGSGPAYFFLIMEILENAAVQLGLDQSSAHLLTLQTALGAARMALESPENTAELRKQVTSPGGTTEQALKSLESHHVREIFTQALEAAYHRSKELADILGK